MTMCRHRWLRHEDVSECVKCGLAVTHDGKVLHDRRFPGLWSRKKRRKGAGNGRKKRPENAPQGGAVPGL